MYFGVHKLHHQRVSGRWQPSLLQCWRTLAASTLVAAV